MAECGNMPDWHPYTQPQASRTSAPTGAQNASTGHMFMSSMSPPALDGMNLSTESRHQSTKHQNDPSAFVARNYQQGGPIPPSNCPTSSSLTSGVHMTPLAGCVSHYSATSTRNAMMESLSSSMDPRMGPAAGISEEVAHRNSQMPFPGPANHPNASSINVNAGNPIHASTMAAQSSPVGSMSPGRQGPGFGACKGPCCNTEANIPYQHWEKYGHYHGAPNANAYRENIRQPAYPIDNRRFMADINLRKECLDGKDIEGPAAPFPVDHRRNYPDYKYRKDNVLPRNYSNNGNNLMQNYPMQNYNFPNDYQKCPYSVKDYMRRGNSGGSINSKNSSLFKYQEQQNVIAQQKYQHSKQMQYQNGSVMANGLQNSTATSSMPSPLQNSYYNAASMPRDLARDYSRDYQQEQSVVVNNRMSQPPNPHVHGSFQKYHQVYHQKMAMQRYSMENHLRAFSRIPGYQSHPKYQECVMRYRELLRLQQTVDYQNVLQEAPKIPSPANPAVVAPINLQFDQNGILINSNFIPTGYSGIHGGINPIASTESTDPSVSSRMNTGVNLEAGNQLVDHTEASMNLTRDLDNHLHRNRVTTMHENPERYFMAGEKSANPERYENERGTANDGEHSISVDEPPKGSEPRAGTSAATANETPNSENIAYKNSKDFADKPELDVRQFLANWDESEDEDTAATSMPDVGLSDSNARHFEEPSFSTKSVENTSQQTNNHSDETTVGHENKEDSSVLEAAGGQHTENVVETAATTTEEGANNDGNQREVGAKEIQCIRSDDDVDDIPTIHIVDSLEGGSEMEKIHTVFGSLASTVLNPISIGETSGDAVGEGETIVLFEQNDGVCAKALEFSVSSEGKTSEVVEGVIASIIDSSTVEAVTIVDPTDKSAYKSSESVDSAANDQLVEPTTSIIASTSTSGATYSTSNSATSSSCSSKSNTDDSTNLPKQNSFTSDESHNPDDISLPDLQTSECTPISTTLNTPIHSDSEESSEHVSDLTISTNPIEIIQNSPIISFTHSPIKIEPYEQIDSARMDRTQRQREHDSLDFDFDREVACRENEKYNETTEASEASVVDDLERGDRNSGDSMLLEDIREPSNNYNEKNCVGNERENEFYPTADPLVGMNHISKSNDQTEGAGQNSKSDTLSAEKNDSTGASSVDRILTSAQIDNIKSPTMLEREDDFNRSEDLEKLCDISLDGSCMIPLIPGEEDCDEPRMPVPPMEGNCLTKILNDTMPITDLNVFESSDEEKIDKPDDDMWVEVQYMDKHLEGNSADRTKNESKKLRKAGKSSEIRQEKKSLTKSKQNLEKIDDTSQEMLAKSNVNPVIEAQERISSPEREREAPHPEADQADKSAAISSLEVHKSTEKRQKEECREASKKSRDSGRRRHSRDGKQSEECSRDLVNEKPLENDTKNPKAKSFLTKHRDSNVKIQVANLNLKIHDNEVIRADSIVSKSKNQESSGDSVDAIEIKINLSRSDLLRSRTKKFFDEDRRTAQELLEVPESNSQTRENVVCPSGNKCCRRRRRSMLDGFENLKRTRKNEDERAQHYTAKRIKNRNRHKIRKSMDDELLMNHERSRNEIVPDERIFHLEMAKTFNLPWPREDVPETGDFCSLLTTKDAETKKDNKSTTTKTTNDWSTDKHTKESRTIPSPSYNSSMENSSTLDFDNFDVAPHNSSDTDPDPGTSINDSRYEKAKARLEDRDRYRNPTNYGSNFDELASLDAFEINLNTVPIYTTKDGRINYSPNRNYTYRALIMEARQREGYPPLRKLHYPRHLAKNHYREDNQRKIYKKRYDDERVEKKRRGVDYHLSKSKRATSSRHHVEEVDTRGTRMKKHDSKRHETRIPSELEYCSNEDTRSFSADRPASKTRSSDSVSASFKLESTKGLPEVESASRRIEILRTDDGAEASKPSSTNYNGPCAIKNMIDSFLSPKHFSNHELDDSIVTTIFQGQELEISSRKAAEDCEERLQSGRLNCRRNSRFFQDSELSLKTPMASPLINLEKRPIGWDIEQDCQTVLSDSGLESSTTYVEARKESTRKIQRWKNSFVKKAEGNRGMYCNRDEYEAIDLSDHKIEEKTARYLNEDVPKSLRISQEEKVEIPVETTTHKTALNEDRIKDKPKEISSISLDEKIEKIIESDKSKIAPATLKPLVKTDIVLEPNRMSEIVKSLDLAITNRHSGVFKEIKSDIHWEPKSLVKKDGPAQIFHRDKQVENLMCKVSEALTRRASSDDVDSREPRNLFFEFPRLPEIEVPEYPEVQDNQPPVVLEEIETKIVDGTTENTQNTEMPTNMAVERSATPETFETPCKDFWIDTSTSFSSCLKLRVPEPVSEMPTESEASQLEDTSTRFASESMDFKEINETSNFQGKFTFSNEENVNSSVIDDVTGRDSFLSNITENAMTASDDCSRKSSELPGESTESKSRRSKDSPEKAPILSFSGQIHDSRHDDSPSKSPPCLINESSIPNLVIEKNESPKSSPKHPLEISRESLEENDKKPSGFDQEISFHPKIPKMIIRNLKSRPGTPTAIEDEAENRNSIKEEQLFQVEIKSGKTEENREECKVPKMKIKLEEKQLPRMMILENASLEISPEVRKNLNKVKIRKVRRSSTSRSPIRAEKVPLVGKLSRQSSETDMQLDFPENMDNSNASSSYKFTLIEKSFSKAHNQSSKVERLEEDSKQDRIPKLTIKKQEVTSSGYSSSSLRKKRRSRSPGESSSRKRKGTSRHSSNSKKEENRSQERRTNSLDNESNTDSQSLSEKVPKVIIKRTSPSAEFKCELSKVGREAITKDSKWQPEVKLQRSWVLDCMAKEPGNGKLALKMLESSLNSKERSERNARKLSDWKRSVSDCDLDKPQSHSLTSISNNRRRSLDEFSMNDRRTSHGKDIIPGEGNYEISECLAKAKKFPCSGVRVGDNPGTTNATKSKSETVKSSSSSNSESGKGDESARNKLNINDSSMSILASKKPEKNAGNYEEIEGSVIKLDSSDESQTTIEILPASPDNSQPELDALERTSDNVGNIHCGAMGKLYSDEAIPTQFELELEIVDNSTVDSLDVPMPMPEDTSLEDDSTSMLDNLHKLERFKPYRVNTEDESVATDLGCEKFVYSDESISLSSKNRADSSLDVEANAKIICCSDSLVKEVLAAKETLKRCLTKAKSISKPKLKLRPKTAAEKKQGSGFHFIGLSEFAKTSKCDVSERAVFHNDEGSVDKIQATVTLDNSTKMKIKDEKTVNNSQDKQDKNHKLWNNERRETEQSVTSSTSSKPSKHSATTSTNLGVPKTGRKSMENESYGENSKTKTVTSDESTGHAEKIVKHRSSVKSAGKIAEKQQSSTASHVPKIEDSSRKIKSYKIPKISQSRTKIGSEESTNQDKRKTPSPTIMPVLEPQVQLDFELAGSDRDTSRSPPVITKQEENNVLTELPKKIEENVHSDKLDSITKQESEAVTFADIVSQLAYHEKATIRHRRYCTLCERWFPTAARHRRHLTGYQHRHTELTQRRTVHALFMLFTGKPCPRLLPASIVRTDCLPGEPTPLQIAVQDVAISLEDGARVTPKDMSEKDQ